MHVEWLQLYYKKPAVPSIFVLNGICTTFRNLHCSEVGAVYGHTRIVPEDRLPVHSWQPGPLQRDKNRICCAARSANRLAQECDIMYKRGERGGHLKKSSLTRSVSLHLSEKEIRVNWLTGLTTRYFNKGDKLWLRHPPSHEVKVSKVARAFNMQPFCYGVTSQGVPAWPACSHSQGVSMAFNFKCQGLDGLVGLDIFWSFPLYDPETEICNPICDQESIVIGLQVISHHNLNKWHCVKEILVSVTVRDMSCVIVSFMLRDNVVILT